MRAVCWMGKHSMETRTVPDPELVNPHDAILKITRTAICGSDLHLYDGFIPTMEAGDIMGHEFMGIVEEVGPEVTNLKRGDRVVVPFTIACGSCIFCKKKYWAACDNTNPNAHLMEKAYGYSGSGLFGYSHMMGGYAGRVIQPVADRLGLPHITWRLLRHWGATQMVEGRVPVKAVQERLGHSRPDIVLNFYTHVLDASADAAAAATSGGLGARSGGALAGPYPASL